MKSINFPKIFLFIFLAYTFNWALSFVYFSAGGSVTSIQFTFVALIGMGTPALATWIVQNLIYKKTLTELGFKFEVNKWFLLAIVVPILIAVFAIFSSLLIPATELTNGVKSIVIQLEDKNVSQEKIKTIKTLLASFGSFLPLILVITSILSAIIFGSTINAIAALGEELGWRGLLQKELEPLGFWFSSFIIGAVWGVWHFPLIINGYNYPENPLSGVIMMTFLTILLSPLLSFIKIKSKTLLASAVMHGVFNAIAGLPVLFIIGGSNLTVGVTGIAGVLVLLFFNFGLYLYQKKTLKL